MSIAPTHLVGPFSFLSDADVRLADLKSSSRCDDAFCASILRLDVRMASRTRFRMLRGTVGYPSATVP